MLRLLQSVNYIIKVILGVAVPQTRLLNIALFYAVILGSVYCLFQFELVDIVGPWFVNEDALRANAPPNSNVFDDTKVQTTVAIDCSTVMLIIVAYLFRNLIFTVPGCTDMGNLHSKLKSKLFWANYSIQYLMLTGVLTLLMIPVLRYIVGYFLKADDQYRERFDRFIQQFYAYIILIIFISVCVYWIGTGLIRRRRSATLRK